MKLKNFLVVAGALALFAVPSFADVYGTNPLLTPPLDGSFVNDYCNGCLFAYAQADASSDGQVFSSWSFDTVSTVYDNNVAGTNGTETPLLFSPTFTLIGIGTTQYGLLAGQQYNFSFGLTSGTDVVTAGDYFGYEDNSLGIIGLSLAGGPGTNVYTCSNGTNNGNAGPCFNTVPTAVGNNYLSGINLVAGRTYEVNFTTAPEPGEVILLSTMLLGVGLMARKRFAELLGRNS
jgi:hypothetical protein